MSTPQMPVSCFQHTLRQTLYDCSLFNFPKQPAHLLSIVYLCSFSDPDPYHPEASKFCLYVRTEA